MLGGGELPLYVNRDSMAELVDASVLETDGPVVLAGSNPVAVTTMMTWWNWYTRYPWKIVARGPCGFESHRHHHLIIRIT